MSKYVILILAISLGFLSTSSAGNQRDFLVLGVDGLFSVHDGKLKLMISPEDLIIKESNELVELKEYIDRHVKFCLKTSQKSPASPAKGAQFPKGVNNWLNTTLNPELALEISISDRVPYCWIHKLFTIGDQQGVLSYYIKTLGDKRSWYYYPLLNPVAIDKFDLIDPRTPFLKNVLLTSKQRSGTEAEWHKFLDLQDDFVNEVEFSQQNLNLNLYADAEGIKISRLGKQSEEDYYYFPRKPNGSYDYKGIRKRLARFIQSFTKITKSVIEYPDPFNKQTISVPVNRYIDSNILTINLRPYIPWAVVKRIVIANQSFPIVIFTELNGDITPVQNENWWIANLKAKGYQDKTALAENGENKNEMQEYLNSTGYRDNSKAKPALRTAEGRQIKLAGEKTSLQACFNSEKANAAQLSGKLTVKYTILADGSVANVKISKSNWSLQEPGRNVERCLIQKVSRWHFNKGKGKTEAEFVLSFY
ncbi:AgmX/PglI C-terminal domain-containing protein [Calditrichota bacterium]